MRFGIKTAPQHTSWGDMLDVWRAAWWNGEWHPRS